MINILFDQYQRYKKAEEIINSIRHKDEPFNILEVGANEHRNLEKFLPHDKITYLDIHLDEEFRNDPQYILGDATQMTFKDNSYDLIIALDVYEHIPNERRKLFLSELNRVAKKGFLLMAPFNTLGVASAERKANAFFKGLTGKDHPWLVEHIQNGLPSWKETIDYLESEKIHYISFEHGSLAIWENLIRYHFLSVYEGTLLPEVNKINTFYNDKIYPIDNRGLCYRKIIVSVDPALQEKIQEPSLEEESIQELSNIEAQFYKKLCRAYANNELLPLKDHHIDNLEHVINELRTQVKSLEESIGLKDNHIHNIEEIIEAKEAHIHDIEGIIKAKDNHIHNIEVIIKHNQKQLQLKDDYIKQIDREIQLKDNHIKNIELVVKSNQDELRAKEKDVKELNNQIELKDNHINNIQAQLNSMKEENRELNEQIKRLEEQVNQKDVCIEQCKEKIGSEEQCIYDMEIRLKDISNNLNLQEKINKSQSEELDYIYKTTVGKIIKGRIQRKINRNKGK